MYKRLFSDTSVSENDTYPVYLYYPVNMNDEPKYIYIYIYIKRLVSKWRRQRSILKTHLVLSCFPSAIYSYTL